MRHIKKNITLWLFNLFFCIVLVFLGHLIYYWITKGHFYTGYWALLILTTLIGIIQISIFKQFIGGTLLFLVLVLCLYLATYNWVHPELKYADDWINFDDFQQGSIEVENIWYTVEYHPFNKQLITIRLILFNKQANNSVDVSFISTRNIARLEYEVLTSIETKEHAIQKGIFSGRGLAETINLSYANKFYIIEIKAEAKKDAPKGYSSLLIGADKGLNIFNENGTKLEMSLELVGNYYICDTPCTWNEFQVSEFQYKEETNKKMIFKTDILYNIPEYSSVMKSFGINALYNYPLILRQIFLAVFTGLIILLTTEIYFYYKANGKSV